MQLCHKNLGAYSLHFIWPLALCSVVLTVVSASTGNKLRAPYATMKINGAVCVKVIRRQALCTTLSVCGVRDILRSKKRTERRSAADSVDTSRSLGPFTLAPSVGVTNHQWMPLARETQHIIYCSTCVGIIRLPKLQTAKTRTYRHRFMYHKQWVKKYRILIHPLAHMHRMSAKCAIINVLKCFWC